MDLIILFKAIIMGIVEGLTEFLPVSSTGHLIIAGDLLDFMTEDRRGMFEIFIQLGAILAICWEYRKKLIQVLTGFGKDPQSRRFLGNILTAFVPAGFMAFLFGTAIKTHLFSPVPVAFAFIIGGLVIFWAERRQHVVRIDDLSEMTWKEALKVGFAQCFALIPGTSRSGATIIGGLFFGLSRRAATEFSFFLAIPTLAAAAFYDLLHHWKIIDTGITWSLAVGFGVSFISALIAVRGLLRYISRHDFTAFAWYRIAFGIIVLLTAHWGIVSWSHR